MRSKCRIYQVAGLVVILSLAIGNFGLALPGKSFSFPSQNPLVVIVADKLNSREFLSSKLPAVKKLIAGSACGLMNIRSGAGYTGTGSGYLSLGSGDRSWVDPNCNGASHPGDLLPGGTAGSYLRWSLNSESSDANLVVPDMGMLLEQTKNGQFTGIPGLLGNILHRNGWTTWLIGNLDTGDRFFHPGGLLLSDQYGLIDGGDIEPALNEKDSLYPNQFRFSVNKTIYRLDSLLDRNRLIVIEFGDFYRLDYYQDLMLPGQFLKLKNSVWNNFNRFLNEINKLHSVKPFSLLLVTPSVSGEAKATGNLLAPLIIQDHKYPPGLLTSGTTKWNGLVANKDFLPTLLYIGGIGSKQLHLSGRRMVSLPVKHHPGKLLALIDRLIKLAQNQRPLLDWYMGLIAACWIGSLIGVVLKKKLWGNYLLTTVMAIPLILIWLPIFPKYLWRVPFFLFGVLTIGGVLCMISKVKTRILILTGLTWGTLLIDQVLGWNLIRFSALGYSAMAGSRYYGMGNEFMGTFLAASLILSQLVVEQSHKRWGAWIVLGAGICTLCLPQLGAKFGGILAGTVGFAYYLMHLYRVKLDNKKLWITLSGFCLILLGIGWWDSLRPAGVQTHIGRFLHLFWEKDFNQMIQIVTRKMEMNLKLTLVSPWMRITLLALIIGFGHRLITKTNLVKTEHDGLVWGAVLVTGIAAYLVNDSGVLALATCLAYGFSYIRLLSISESNINVC